MNNALIIFAKTPLPNFSKTRLIDPFTPEQAAEFYSCSLEDVSDTMQESSDFDLWLGIAPEKFKEELFPLKIRSENYFFQEGEDLGIRMLNAFKVLFEKGYKKTAIIGSDFPHISVKTIEQTFDFLNYFDCVLGPTVDGGYYLIGLNKLNESIFKDINWSTEKVYQQTLDKGKVNNISITNLDKQYDVDTISEIRKLYFDLKKMDISLKFFPANVWQFLQKYKNIFL
jgi:rSAM/selenodomain-associated transferase 1